MPHAQKACQKKNKKKKRKEEDSPHSWKIKKREGPCNYPRKHGSHSKVHKFWKKLGITCMQVS